MVTLGTFFGGIALSMGGGKKTPQAPPINAGSKDEENFVKYVSLHLPQSGRRAAAMDPVLTYGVTESSWNRQMRMRRRRRNTRRVDRGRVENKRVMNCQWLGVHIDGVLEGNQSRSATSSPWLSCAGSRRFPRRARKQPEGLTPIFGLPPLQKETPTMEPDETHLPQIPRTFPEQSRPSPTPAAGQRLPRSQPGPSCP